MLFLGNKGYRIIAHDRRSHDRSHRQEKHPNVLLHYVSGTCRVNGAAAGTQLQQRSAAVKPELTWTEQQMPRIATLPMTAPKYNAVTKPERAHRPAACVLMRGECRCYTQQATRLQTDDSVCRQIVANGYFLDYDGKPLPADNLMVKDKLIQQNELQPVALHDLPQGETVVFDKKRRSGIKTAI